MNCAPQSRCSTFGQTPTSLGYGFGMSVLGAAVFLVPQGLIGAAPLPLSASAPQARGAIRAWPRTPWTTAGGDGVQRRPAGRVPPPPEPALRRH